MRTMTGVLPQCSHLNMSCAAKQRVDAALCHDTLAGQSVFTADNGGSNVGDCRCRGDALIVPHNWNSIDGPIIWGRARVR